MHNSTTQHENRTAEMSETPILRELMLEEKAGGNTVFPPLGAAKISGPEESPVLVFGTSMNLLLNFSERSLKTIYVVKWPSPSPGSTLA
jgi:hypothetical protein